MKAGEYIRLTKDKIKIHFKRFIHSEWLPISVDLFILGVSVAILIVALYTISLQSEQGKIQKDYTEWVRAEQARRPIMYLTSTGVSVMGKDTVRVTFLLINKGDAIAENVQIVFRLPEFVEPSGEHLVRFSPYPIMKDYVYLKFAFSEKSVQKIVYFDKDPKAKYMTKLACTLDFIVSPEIIEADSFPIGYRIDCASQGTGDWQSLKVANPFKEVKGE